MATTAVDPVFVDANVLIYSTVQSAPLYSAARATIQNLRTAGVELWTSRQVLREYLAAPSRPQSYTGAIPAANLIADVVHFQAHFQIADEGQAGTAELLALLAAVPIGGKQVHDANIVATMRVHGLRQLLTHNTADFARFAAFVTVLPL